MGGGCGVAWIGDVFLRDGAQVDDGIGDAIGASEGDEDPAPAAVVSAVMVHSDIAAAIAQQRARVEGRDQLEGGELGAPACTAEGLGDAGGAHAVCDVNEPRQFLELVEERERDVVQRRAGGW